MGKAAIFYFSGTGNSLAVARDIAGKINGKVTSIPAVMDKESITSEADTIGIVFPVYHAVFDGIPLIIKRFAGKIENPGSKYIFAVCTCKGWSRVALSKLDKIIRSRGGILSAGFTVPMPDNTSPGTLEKQQRYYTNWQKKLENISRYVNARKKGRIENTVLYNLIIAPLSSPLQKATIKLLAKLAESPPLPHDELLPLTDKNFIADEKCNACEICSKVCPVSNIVMVEKKPVWQHHCESCLACVNWCPQKAIQGGISFKNNTTVRYHHPGVKAADFLRRE
jgi:ferredoxin